MTVKERHASRDGFPVGMRVLAVDDDPTCLKILERLLLQCRYHVTTTGQAVTALNLLRENKDQFDLVISDVHMPDMDGFKLLELVGLEMDLPVIMLSTNGETQIVMNGITHGACDYLLKPVRIEELRNIWQHVVRRRKFDAKDHSKGDNVDGGQKMQAMNSEGEQSGVNRNRKHLRNGREENGDDGNDSDHENADLSTQKRPRVVWSVELHRKFVAAVNQLGIDKAVPKKILDLMNVDSITRENVASHLQKYRLYLKRLSTDVTNQPNLAATFGGSNPTFINMNSLEAFKHYHAYGRYRSVPSAASSQGNKLLERMNTPSTFGVHGLLPSQSAQLVHPQNNVGTSLKDLGGFTQGNLLKSTLLSLQEGSKCFPTGPSRNNFANISNGAPSGNSSANISNGASLAPVNKFPVQPLESSNQPLVPMHSSSTDPFNALVDEEAPQFPDLGRFSNTRQSVVPPKFQDAHKDNMSQAALHVNGPKVKPLSSFAEPSGHASVLGNGLQSVAASLASNTTEVANFNQEAASFNFGTCGNSMDMLNNNLSFSPSSINSSLPDLCADSSVVARQSLDGGNPVGVPPAQHSRIDQEAVGNQLNYNDDFLTGTRELHSGASGALDDIAIDMFNPDREGGISFMDEDWELVTIP